LTFDAYFLEKILPYLFSALISAGIAAFVAVKLLPKQFYQQQWWLRRIQAYVDGLDALAKLHHYYRERIIALEENQPLQGADVDNQHRRDARRVLKSLESSGGFLISTEATAVLTTVHRTLDFDEDLEHPLPELERDFAAVEIALPAFRSAANRDLARNTFSSLDVFLVEHRMSVREIHADDETGSRRGERGRGSPAGV
jgi:hypothetical protein